MNNKATVFTSGTGGHACYRIPALVRTTRGTLLLFCEARQRNCGDWTHGAIMARRCVDPVNALDTWEEAFVVHESKRLVAPRSWPEIVEAGAFADIMGWDQEAEGFKPRIDVCTNNPVPIVDGDGETIHLVFCDHYDRAYYSRSIDDGVSWSDAVEITPVLARFNQTWDWTVIAAGPGHGVQLKLPPHEGRLIVPFWLASNHDDPAAHRPSRVATIVSDDRGITWKPGGFVPPTIENPSESQLVEMDDGRVLMISRSEHSLDKQDPKYGRAWTTSTDGGEAWNPYRIDPSLPETVCLGSFNRHGKTLFYSTCNAGGRERANLTLFTRHMDEHAWIPSHVIEPGPAAYSDLAVDGARGIVYCAFEDGSIPGKLGPYNGISVSRIKRVPATSNYTPPNAHGTATSRPVP